MLDNWCILGQTEVCDVAEHLRARDDVEAGVAVRGDHLHPGHRGARHHQEEGAGPQGHGHHQAQVDEIKSSRWAPVDEADEANDDVAQGDRKMQGV